MLVLQTEQWPFTGLVGRGSLRRVAGFGMSGAIGAKLMIGAATLPIGPPYRAIFRCAVGSNASGWTLR